MTERRNGLSDAVIIEIIHGIKDILIRLIDCAFQEKQIAAE